jgi:hypothetical protein
MVKGTLRRVVEMIGGISVRVVSPPSTSASITKPPHLSVIALVTTTPPIESSASPGNIVGSVMSDVERNAGDSGSLSVGDCGMRTPVRRNSFRPFFSSIGISHIPTP